MNLIENVDANALELVKRHIALGSRLVMTSTAS